MTIVTELANGNTEVFQNTNYAISRVKDFHPLIVSVKVYENGMLIAHRSRRLKWLYKHVTFKSRKVQEALQKLSEQQAEEAKAKN